MLRIAIVEDDADTRAQLNDFLTRYAREHSLEIQISLFSDGSEILENYRPVYDILLLDIEMPGINGMDAAEQIRLHDSEVVMVFVTSLSQYAIRGYSVGALDYVLKPVSYYTFSLKLDRAVERIVRRSSGHIVLRLTDGMVRLETRQIYYVEIQHGVLHYMTALGEFTLRGTLQSAEEALSSYHFVRCNYWYLVNLMHVSKVTRDTVEVAGYPLQISRRNKAAFLDALTDYVGGGV